MKDRWKRKKSNKRIKVNSLQLTNFSSLGGSIRGQSARQRVPGTDKFKVRMRTQEMTTNSS